MEVVVADRHVAFWDVWDCIFVAIQRAIEQCRLDTIPILGGLHSSFYCLSRCNNGFLPCALR